MCEPRLCRVTALLASAPGLPRGDTACGVELELCLNSASQPAPRASGTDLPWSARRFWKDRPDWHGYLVPMDGDRWAMRGSDDPDGPLWELQVRLFRPGEYLMLRRPNGDELSFRIVSVQAVQDYPCVV